jgi:glycosyltransferase involved in cell wall biosynthesis
MSLKNEQTTWPLVSVVIPVYNGEDVLPTLLESLDRLDYPSNRLEVILVDNNSKDSTPELLATTSFKVVFEAQPGCGTARNAGILCAEGEFIACTDADCVVDPAWIKDLLAGFNSANIGAVAGTLQPYAINHPIERYEALRLNDPGHRSIHIFLPTSCTANTMYRADVFRQIGLLLNRSGGEETDFNWRMQTQTNYRIHFLEHGGLVKHRYRTNLRSFCNSQLYKARTLIDLHQRWNLYVPTGRMELLRTGIAVCRFMPEVVVGIAQRRSQFVTAPIQVLYECFWEAWLDILVPWTRYRGIRQGLQQIHQQHQPENK